MHVSELPAFLAVTVLNLAMYFIIIWNLISIRRFCKREKIHMAVWRTFSVSLRRGDVVFAAMYDFHTTLKMSQNYIKRLISLLTQN